MGLHLWSKDGLALALLLLLAEALLDAVLTLRVALFHFLLLYLQWKSMTLPSPVAACHAHAFPLCHVVKDFFRDVPDAFLKDLDARRPHLVEYK